MNAVYITNVTPLLNKEVYNYYYDRVSQQRKQKADGLKYIADKARCVGAGAVLRFAVEECTPYNFDELELLKTESGKPYVKNNPFYFSLSHSGDYAVCVISDTPVGIDIELDKPLADSMQKRFAKNILEWTKKEAKGKLTGVGFFDKSETDYVYTHKKTDGYIITVCSDKTIDNFFEYHLPFPC